MATTVISYPTPLYQNLPIQPQYYKPSRFVITNILLGQTTIITTSVSHNYVLGQLIRLIIPSSYGTRQLNDRQGYVISKLSSTQVEVDIYSSGMDEYIAGSGTTKPQILAIGNIANGDTNDSGRTFNATAIPGSFQNISPN